MTGPPPFIRRDAMAQDRQPAWKPLLPVILVVATGLGLRLWFLGLPGFENDLQWQLGWGRRVCEKGFWDLYAGDFARRTDRPYREVVDYPPLVPLVAAGVYAASGHLHFGAEAGKRAKVEWRMKAMKGFATGMELIFLTMAGLWLLRGPDPWRWPAFAFLFLNPALAFASAGWGQSDSLGILLVFAAFLAESRNRHAWSCFFILLAVLAKLQTVVGLLVYFAVLLAKRKYRLFWIHGICGFVVLAAFIVLFKVFGHSNFTDIYLGAVGAFPAVSWTAWNPWWLAFGAASPTTTDTTLWGPLSLRAWSLLAWLAASAWGGWRFFRSPRQDLSETLLFLGWVFVCFALLPTQGHERYLSYAIAFLCLSAARSPLLLGAVTAFTVTAYLNAAHVLRHYVPELHQDSFASGTMAAALVGERSTATQQGLAALATVAMLVTAVEVWLRTRRRTGEPPHPVPGRVPQSPQVSSGPSLQAVDPIGHPAETRARTLQITDQSFQTGEGGRAGAAANVAREMEQRVG